MCILTCLIGVPKVVRLQVVVFREVLPCSVERPQAFVIVGYDSVRLVDAARAFRQLRVPDPLRPRALLWLPEKEKNGVPCIWRPVLTVSKFVCLIGHCA